MKYIGNYPEQEIVHTTADRYDYVFASNPTISINPSAPYATWLNSSTGEMWVCLDNSVGSNIWKSTGGTIFSQASLGGFTVPNNSWALLKYDSVITDYFGLFNTTSMDRFTLTGSYLVTVGINIIWNNANDSLQVEGRVRDSLSTSYTICSFREYDITYATTSRQNTFYFDYDSSGETDFVIDVKLTNSDGTTIPTGDITVQLQSPMVKP